MSTTEEPTPEPLPQAEPENLIPESTFDPSTGQQLPVEVADQEESDEEEDDDESS